MPDPRRVLTFEKKLGFIWADKGISKVRGESCKVGVVKDMIKDVDKVKVESVHVLPSELRRSISFNSRCRALFDKHAHRLWPRPDINRSAWLVDAAQNDWNGLYTRNLYVGEHDSELYQLFTSMVFEKCVRYHENQKQQERRALKNMSVSDTPEVESPWMDSDSDEDISVWTQAMRSGVALSPERPESKRSHPSHEQTFGTAIPAKSSDRPLGAPVAQMTPMQQQTIRGNEYLNKSIEGKDTASSSAQQDNQSEAIYLSDDDSQLMEQDNQESLARNPCLSPSSQAHPEVDARESPSTDRTCKRLKPPNYYSLLECSSLEYAPPREKRRKKKVDSSNKLFTASKIAPERLAPVLKDSPKRPHDSIETSEHSKPQSNAKRSKIIADGDSTLCSNPEQLAPSSKSRLKIRLSATKSSAASKPSSSSRLNETTGIGTAAYSSAPYVSNEKKSPQSQEDQTPNLKPGINDNSISSPTTTQKGKQATDVSHSRESPHPSANAVSSIPADWSKANSEAPPSGTDRSYVDSTLPKAHEQSTRMQPPQPWSKGVEPPVESEPDSSEIQRLRRPLISEHCKSQPPDTSQMSFPRANEGLANENRDECSTTQVNQPEHISEDSDTFRNSHTKAHIPVDGHIMDEVKSAKSSTTFQSEVPNQADMDSTVSQTLADNRNGDPRDRMQAQSFTQSGVEAQPKDDKEEAKPTGIGPSPGFSDTALGRGEMTTPEIRAQESPAAAAHANPTPKTETASTAQGVISDNLKPPKKLVIQLNLPGVNLLQFVIIGVDTDVETLFVQVQARMNRRLDNQAIESLQLRLLDRQEHESNAAYLIERNDPDTWETFLDSMGHIEAAKIKVIADVEV